MPDGQRLSLNAEERAVAGDVLQLTRGIQPHEHTTGWIKGPRARPYAKDDPTSSKFCGACVSVTTSGAGPEGEAEATALAELAGVGLAVLATASPWEPPAAGLREAVEIDWPQPATVPIATSSSIALRTRSSQ